MLLVPDEVVASTEEDVNAVTDEFQVTLCDSTHFLVTKRERKVGKKHVNDVR